MITFLTWIAVLPRCTSLTRIFHQILAANNKNYYTQATITDLKYTESKFCSPHHFLQPHYNVRLPHPWYGNRIYIPASFLKSSRWKMKLLKNIIYFFNETICNAKIAKSFRISTFTLLISESQWNSTSSRNHPEQFPALRGTAKRLAMTVYKKNNLRPHFNC